MHSLIPSNPAHHVAEYYPTLFVPHHNGKNISDCAAPMNFLGWREGFGLVMSMHPETKYKGHFTCLLLRSNAVHRDELKTRSSRHWVFFFRFMQLDKDISRRLCRRTWPVVAFFVLGERGGRLGRLQIVLGRDWGFWATLVLDTHKNFPFLTAAYNTFIQ